MMNEDRAIELLVEAMQLCKRVDPWADKFGMDYPGYPTDIEARASALYWKISEELGILSLKDASDEFWSTR